MMPLCWSIRCFFNEKACLESLLQDRDVEINYLKVKAKIKINEVKLHES